MQAEWKEFQDVVARIERIAAGQGAVVRSPDRIRDLVTGRSREVDVSVRQRIGSADVLITVECRRRKSADDVTWIEQLTTKRENIGAALTIAVSASKFSRGSVSLAGRKGIALRHLTELTDEEIKLLLIPVFRVTPHVRIVNVGFELADSTILNDPSRYPKALLSALEKGADAPLFRAREGERSLNEVLMAALRPLGTAPFDRVPEDGTAVLKQFQLKVPPGMLQIDMPDGSKDVALIVMEVWLHVTRELIPPDLAVRYDAIGNSESRGSIRHGEYEIPDEKRPVRITVQEDSSEQRIGVEIRDRDGNLRPADLEYLRGGRLPRRGS